MFDIKATQAWWNFFHRFSLVYTGTNFDYIALLGINLLQCYQCQEDALQFYKTIGSHKSPFEKIHILHNYVNRKLKKPIYDIEDTRKISSDIMNVEQTINWERLLTYYYNLLFAMTEYLNSTNLHDFKAFSAYVFQGLNIPKKISALSINITEKDKFSREVLQLQTYEYYHKLLSSLNLENKVKSFPQIYGRAPKKTKVCKSCAKRHQLYVENHNKSILPQPTTTLVSSSRLSSIKPTIISRAQTSRIMNPTIGLKKPRSLPPTKIANSIVGQMPTTTNIKPPMNIITKPVIHERNSSNVNDNKNVKSVKSVVTNVKSVKKLNVVPKEMSQVKTIKPAEVSKFKKPSKSGITTNPYKGRIKFAQSKIIHHKQNKVVSKK